MQSVQKNAMNGNKGNMGNGGDWRGVIIVAMGALSLLSGVIWWALTTQMAQIQHEREVDKSELRHTIDQVKAESTSTYTRIEEVKRLDGELVEIRRRIDTIINGMIRADKKTSDLYLTKDAYSGPHNALIEQLKNLQDRNVELRQEVAKIITPADTIKELQERLKALETRSYQQKKIENP